MLVNVLQGEHRTHDFNASVQVWVIDRKTFKDTLAKSADDIVKD